MIIKTILIGGVYLTKEKKINFLINNITKFINSIIIHIGLIYLFIMFVVLNVLIYL